MVVRLTPLVPLLRVEVAPPDWSATPAPVLHPIIVVVLLKAMVLEMLRLQVHIVLFLLYAFSCAKHFTYRYFYPLLTDAASTAASDAATTKFTAVQLIHVEKFNCEGILVNEAEVKY